MLSPSAAGVTRMIHVLLNDLIFQVLPSYVTLILPLQINKKYVYFVFALLF